MNSSIILEYSQKYTSCESDLLHKLRIKTELDFPNSHMISGHYQGRILSLLSCLLKPKKILEIGTFTGYSAICLAEGLVANGILHTIDINESLNKLVNNFIKEAGFSDKIKTHFGDAKIIIPNLNDNFDLVFIDANKKSYSEYYDLIFDKVTKGGLIIADNVLWKGKVLNKNIDDKIAKSIIEFNNKVFSDKRTEKIFLPIRDGLFLIRKL